MPTTLVVGVLLACAQAPKPSPEPAGSSGVSDTVWYISARARIDGRESRQLTDSLEYGFVVYRHPRLNDALTDGVDLTLADSVRLTDTAFVRRLRERAAGDRAPDDFLVLYVHGFGTSLHEAWEYMAETRIRTRATTPWVVFCWPSKGLGISWPRGDELLTQAYHDDLEVALASRWQFVRSVQAVVDAVGAPHVLLVSHSLGSRIVSDAMTTDFGLRGILAAEPLRAIAFFAPDVDAQAFADSVVPVASQLARRVVLYTSSRDRMLAVARTIHDTERAGQAPDVPRMLPGLETVDVTDGLAAEGWFQGIFGPHHAIRRASGALFDMLNVVGAGYAADCREQLGTATRTDEGTWRLAPARPPATSARLACDRH